MKIVYLLNAISEPLNKWQLDNMDAEPLTLSVDTTLEATTIHVGYSKPIAKSTRLSYHETTIQVSRAGEVTIKKPKRL